MLRNSHHMKTISRRLSVRKIKPNTQTQQLSSTSENPMRKTQTPGSVYDAAVNDLPRSALLSLASASASFWGQARAARWPLEACSYASSYFLGVMNVKSCGYGPQDLYVLMKVSIASRLLSVASSSAPSDISSSTVANKALD